MLKKCKDCGTEKSQVDFYPTQGECKECTKDRMAKYRLANIEKVMQHDRNRPNALERSRKIALLHKENLNDIDYKKMFNQRQKAWADKRPLHKKANQAVGNAIRVGRLIRQPCEVCSELIVEAHHDDYSKPLDVRWLCRKHHYEHHKTERAIARGSS